MKSTIISKIAETDLEEIWFYIALDNENAADLFLDKIFDGFQNLSEMPNIGRLRTELAFDLRSWNVQNYIIFYRENLSSIEIVRVLHGSRDINYLFN